jgi:orotidine-5'-phosphate decarboxylase
MAAGSVKAAERLIVALDVPNVAEARAITEALGGTVSFYKVGLHLQMAEGLEAFVGGLMASDARVFIDYKWNDIPETVRGGVAGAAKRGVDFVTLQGSVGITRETLERAVEGRGDAKTRLLLVTVLTSMTQADLAAMGIDAPIAEVVVARARLAREAGLDGVIASAQEVALIRRAVAPVGEFLVVTPGIRPAGASLDDQQRVATPAKAIADGADYLVVGRPIVKAPDRRAAAEAIIAEMQAAFDAR